MGNSIYKMQLGEDFIYYKDRVYRKLKTHFMTETGMPICGAGFITKFSKNSGEVTCRRCQAGLDLRERIKNENLTELQG